MVDLSWNKIKGTFFLSMVVVIWVASAMLIRLIFTSDDTNFNKPLFLTYFSTSWFSLYLIPLIYDVICLYCFSITKKNKKKNKEETALLNNEESSEL